MAGRASWKGVLTIDALACPVALYTAVSSSERLSFHIVNRKTGNRVERQFVDSETGKPVPRDEQVKGYRLDDGDYIRLEGEELSATLPESDKTMTVESFIGCEDIDKLFFERPYYLGPGDREAEAALSLVAAGMRARKVAALARAVLFRRERSLLLRPQADHIVATLLNFDYEVRPAASAFKSVPAVAVTDEMLDLAAHIITTKHGSFDPAAFEDRYEAALTELVKAKIEGRALPKPKPAAAGRVVNLMDALKQSARLAGAGTKKRSPGKAAPRSKAG